MPPLSVSTAPKIAIPRLRRKSDAKSMALAAGRYEHRVSHACEPCRHRKTKCSGEQPICKHCEDFNLVCAYADGKRLSTNKLLPRSQISVFRLICSRQLGSMAARLEEYERLLRELSVSASENDQARIERVFEKVSRTILRSVL